MYTNCSIYCKNVNRLLPNHSAIFKIHKSSVKITLELNLPADGAGQHSGGNVGLHQGYQGS